jgi:hypothetical protein
MSMSVNQLPIDFFAPAVPAKNRPGDHSQA